jgi:hypothetical protein
LGKQSKENDIGGTYRTHGHMRNLYKFQSEILKEKDNLEDQSTVGGDNKIGQVLEWGLDLSGSG